MVQTTDKSSHAKWEFNCKQFLWIMGPSVPPYAKEEKIPIKKKKNFSLPHPPKLTPKETVARVFLAGEPSTELETSLGTSCRVGLAKSKGQVGQA